MNYSKLYQLLIKAYSLGPRLLLGGYAFPPVQVFVEVTYQCNLRCGFCQFRWTAASGERHDELHVKQLWRALKAAPRGCIISFTGGEPFVKPGFLDLLGKASQRHRTHIFTNGTRIDEPVAGRLLDLGAKTAFSKGLVLVGVSLEGLRATHDRVVDRRGAFDRTVHGIRSLVAARRARGKAYPLIEVKAVISEENVGELHALFRLAGEMGADIFNIMAMNMAPHDSRVTGRYLSPHKRPPDVEPVDTGLLERQLARIKAHDGPMQLRTTPQGLGLEELLAYYENRLNLSRYTCYYPWYGLTVTAHGDVIVCPYQKIGNVRETGLRALYNNPKARSFRRQLHGGGIFPGCLGCCFLTR